MYQEHDTAYERNANHVELIQDRLGYRLHCEGINEQQAGKLLLNWLKSMPEDGDEFAPLPIEIKRIIRDFKNQRRILANLEDGTELRALSPQQAADQCWEVIKDILTTALEEEWEDEQNSSWDR